jgi:hypothetical protein
MGWRLRQVLVELALALTFLSPFPKWGIRFKDRAVVGASHKIGEPEGRREGQLFTARPVNELNISVVALCLPFARPFVQTTNVPSSHYKQGVLFCWLDGVCLATTK